MGKNRVPLSKIPELGDFNTIAAVRTVSDGRKRPLQKKHGTGESADKATTARAQASRRTGRAITLREPAPNKLPEAGIAAATPFELSRLYAQGWTAGMSHPIDDTLIVVDARGEALNPFRISGERARWMQGFTEAVRAKLARPSQKQPHYRTGSLLSIARLNIARSRVRF
jgi:hypothetical protein